MSKKYLSLEEAAARLKISVQEMNEIRESGQLRGFADRGSWKFRAEDVEEIARRRQPDSDPDIPLMADLNVFEDEVDAGSKLAGSSVVLDDDDVLGQQPTEIRGSSGHSSDSDIRLVVDDTLGSVDDSSPDVKIASDDLPGSHSDVKSIDDSSDSDVKLIGADSDSDVKLADSDSDVRLSADDASDSDVRLDQSDSDVTLVPEGDSDTGGSGPSVHSDSDIRLVQVDDAEMASDSDVKLLSGHGSSALDIDLDSDSSASVLVEDSGVRLEDSDKTGSGVLSGDSGIRLQSPADSGISLEGTQHELAIQDDDDSGIGLASGSETLAGDSGIRLGMPDDSGIALTEDKTTFDVPMDMTVPMVDAVDDTAGDTDLEVPMIEDDVDDDSAFELTPLEGEGEDSAVDFDEPVTAAQQSGATGDSSLFELEDEMELDDDAFVEDDVVEFADEDDFADTFDADEGESSYAMPVSGYAPPPAEREWGAGSLVLTAASVLVTAIGCMAAFDLVTTISNWNQPGVSSSIVLHYVSDLFK